MADAGRIAIVPRGVWNADTEYEFLDAVFYNHTSWLAKQNNINQIPSEGSAYWQMMTTAAVDSVMIGATATTDGAKGIVPQPIAGDNKKVLKGDGTWADYSSGILISQDEYDELTQEQKNEGIYFIYDADDAPFPYEVNAEDVNYDNSNSGLSSTDVNSAIDEIVENILHIEYDSEDESIVIPDGIMSYDSEEEEITLLI